MNAAQKIFVVFFAIFWGTTANAWPKWTPFHWTFLTYSRRVASRILWSVVMLNIFPVLFFAWMLQRLGGETALSIGWASVMSGVIPAFAVFGLYRLWVAGIELCPTAFYYQSLDDLLAQRKVDLSHVEPTMDSLYLKPKWWWANALWGVMYMVVAVLPAII
jgi:hypothetical protein